MTAVVGVLNKQAVAIAADSAVTIGGSNGKKIFNAANKIFTLSKIHPVGIMIYNSASFMGTPWETIIKVYRQELKDKSFATVKEYQEDFINFLKSKNFYDQDNVRLRYLKSFSTHILENYIFSEVERDIKQYLNQEPAVVIRKFYELMDATINKHIDLLKRDNDICPEFESYELTEFIGDYEEEVTKSIKGVFVGKGLDVPVEVNKSLVELTYHALRSQRDIYSYTGLIFTGFGDSEIFPQLIPVKVNFAVGSKLKYHINRESIGEINQKSNAVIRPFAQKDVIETILTGIDPAFEQTVLQNFQKSINKYNELILKTIGDSNPTLTAQIKSIDSKSIIAELGQTNARYKSLNHIRPLMAAVSTLSKEDLGEMAESLIYLTYLKRRITFAEESVGGPVDVAIISKGDGFIWMKRKHYFDPKLNMNFFKNYFNP